MHTTRAFAVGAVLGFCAMAVFADETLLRIWSASDVTVRERADAVNRAFTNGTPVSAVIAVLGTNYIRCGSSARVWMGPEPEPPNTWWLSYRFGEEEVTIGTSAVFGKGLDATSSKFTGAGYSFPVAQPSNTTNRIWIGKANERQPDWVKKPAQTTSGIGPVRVNGSQPIRSGTNQTPAADHATTNIIGKLFSIQTHGIDWDSRLSGSSNKLRNSTSTTYFLKVTNFELWTNQPICLSATDDALLEEFSMLTGKVVRVEGVLDYAYSFARTFYLEVSSIKEQK